MKNEIEFRGLLDLYKKHRLLRPATIECYSDAVTNLERFAGRGVRLDGLSVDLLLEHRLWCLSRIKATSYNKHRRHLRALLNFAISEGLFLESQPFAKVGPAPTGARRPKTVPVGWYKKTMRLLDRESVAGLKTPHFWRLIFTVLHFTGMRRRQLVELRWQHVQFSRSSLLLVSEGSKSRKEWFVPIPQWVCQDLKDLKAETALLMGRSVADTEQVFFLPAFSARIRVGSLTVGHISRAFEALSRHLGFRISSHRVRHTSATVMVGRSGNIKAVSDILGHSDIKLTASTYIHPRLGELRKVQHALHGYKDDDFQRA